MRHRGTFFGQNAVDANSPEYAGWWGILTGCVPDARDLAIAFANMGFACTAKFSGHNVAGPAIPWITTLDCTTEAWRQAHIEAQAEAQLGDFYIFGNSGHGGTYPTASGQGETLCFADGQIDDREQFNWMKLWPPGVRVVYIIDACHSGGMDRDRLRAVPRCAPKWVSDRNSLRVSPPIMSPSDVQAQIIQLCACQSDQLASDGQFNGAFTSSLLAVWEQARVSGRKLTWREWMRGTIGVMNVAFPNQTPVLNVLGAGMALADELIPTI